MSPVFTFYETKTSPDWDGDTNILPIKTLFFVGYPTILPLEAMKRITLLQSLF